MYRIAICDDDVHFCSRLENIVYQYQKEVYNNIDIDIYYSGEDLYQGLLQGILYDLIFLDIEMGELNGIELGRKLRKELDNDITHLAYVSSFKKYAIELFKIRPIDFIIKPVTEAKIYETIRQAMILSGKQQSIFSYYFGKTEKRKPMDEILFFESKGRMVEITTLNDQDTFYSSLSKVYEKLNPKKFLYIHRSFIVNYSYVISMNNHEIIMSNKARLPVGKNHIYFLNKFIKEYEDN